MLRNDRSRVVARGLALACLSLLALPGRAHAEPVCRAVCSSTNGDTLSYEETRAVAASFEGILNELRTCLGTIGASSIDPAVLLRFDGAGNLLSKRYDLAGYEGLACARSLEAQPTAAAVRRETSLRCESRCSAGARAAPAPAPVSAAPVPMLPGGGTARTTAAVVTPASAPVTPAATAVTPASTADPGGQRLAERDAPPVPAPPARPSPPAPPAPTRLERTWYGGQTLIADGVSLGVLVGGGLAGSRALTAVGATSWVLATPVVHGVHGNVGPAVGSASLRLFGPPTLGFFGLLVGATVGGAGGKSLTSFAGGA